MRRFGIVITATVLFSLLAAPPEGCFAEGVDSKGEMQKKGGVVRAALFSLDLLQTQAA